MSDHGPTGLPTVPAAAPAGAAATRGIDSKTNGPADMHWAMRLLLFVVALLLAVVIVSPIALSSGELVRWASSPNGLGLPSFWPWLVFIALDCAAFACVLLAVYCAFLGRGAGVFGLLVWVFAGFSAFANYRHGVEPGAPRDAWWFFPVMSILGPGLLEAVTHFIRNLTQKKAGKRADTLPKFGMTRWLPLVGAPRDTFGARRTAQILGITTVDEAVAEYHALCPDGSLRVVRAIRARDVAAAAARSAADQAAAEDAARLSRAATEATAKALRSGALTVDQVADHQATILSANGATRIRPAAATSRPSPTTIRAAVGTGHATSPATGPSDSDDHSPLAVSDAATIRAAYPDGLPESGAQRKLRAPAPDGLGWHATKASNALRAYRAGADLPPSGPAEGSALAATGSGSATDPATT